MSKTYLIRWKSKVNGRAGRGSKLFERAEAERLVAELNQEYPEIEHELFETDAEPRSPSPTSQSRTESEARPTHEDPSHAFSE